ncbi:hypothetical protein ACFPM0_12800 [Pseudonocardia sulfidoxydans]|uniref:hypothetical protein n=1 Tax=Pseudonocardia sulfidoxydans TaxID=54011 RepID=UPI00360B69AE
MRTAVSAGTHLCGPQRLDGGRQRRRSASGGVASRSSVSVCQGTSRLMSKW